jgi:MurNAc alpha-1-phosphate uridylyltransferase
MTHSIPVMLLAAGRGERMRPITDKIPKPLLPVRGRALLQWHVDAFAAAGFRDFVINTAWLGKQISTHFGKEPRSSDGQPVSIAYSWEGEDFGGALETAGGISRALPLLGDMFWVVAGDVYTPNFPFSLAAVQRFARSDMLAHIWLVPNPPHNPKGDFGIATSTNRAEPLLALNQAQVRYTYSTIGLYRRAFFMPPYCSIPPGNSAGIQAPLAPLLRAAMDNRRVSAELYPGPWADVGTPERFVELNEGY